MGAYRSVSVGLSDGVAVFFDDYCVSSGQVDESGALAHAERTCGEGEGDGILPGSVGWTTVTLASGRYEVLCNIAGHYAAGMYTQLDVVGNR